jgi:phosphatidylglycerol---prolipoprotein diacylglyceryl transferase
MMLPTLFKIGPITIHSFGFMLAIAFLLVAWVAAKEFNRRGYSSDDAWTITLAAMIGGVVGAKLYFAIDHWSETVNDPDGVLFSGAGLTYYGGLIGGAIGVILAARKKNIPIGVMADMGAPLIALGYGVGRIGCLLNGDDYGKPCTFPWCMSFPNGNPPSLDAQHNLVRVHPTQIYESVTSLMFFAFLWSRRAAWQSRRGLLMGVYLVLAGTERFLIEFLRLNSKLAAGLTMAQWISLALIATGFVLIARSRVSKLNAVAPARTVACL